MIMNSLSKYQNVLFEEDTNILIFKWLPETINMIGDDFMTEMNKVAKIIMQHNGCNILLLSQDMKFAIAPDKQIEANKILLPAYNQSSVKKLAIIIPKEFIAELSMEQTIEEKIDEHSFKTNFFADEKEAQEWLMNK